MTPRPDARRHHRRAARGPLGALLATVMLAAAATLTGCATFSDTVPSCGDPLRLAIIAQSVPGASYLPCILGLPQGWSTSGFDPSQDGTSFLLNSDRSPGQPVMVRLTAACNDQRGQPLPLTGSRRAHLHPARLDLAPVRRPLYDVFPGGCISYGFDFASRFADRVGGTIRGSRRPVSEAAAAAHPEAETRRGAQPMTELTDAADHSGILTPALRSPAEELEAFPRRRAGRSPGPARGRDSGPSGHGHGRAPRSRRPVRDCSVPDGQRPARLALPARLGHHATGRPRRRPRSGRRGMAGREPRAGGPGSAGGTSAWALSKVAKRIVRRPRPAILLPGTRCRGREAAGLGYLSGHAGVAVALGAAALPRLGTAGRALTLSTVPVVGLTRVYVGAHLPLDVAGGMALGLAIEAAMTLVTSCIAQPAPRGSSEHL